MGTITGFNKHVMGKMEKTRKYIQKLAWTRLQF